MISTFETIIQHYDRCASLVEDDARAMGWSSQFNQNLRFEVINYLVDLSGSDILDVGCGDGALFHFLMERDNSFNYKGIDISSKMIQRAQTRYPGISIRQSNFFDYYATHDVVICSGGLSICSEKDPMVFLNYAIDHLLKITNEHLIFNVLSAKSSKKDPLFNYYEPSVVLDLCFTKSSYVTMHHSYLPNDFTIHIVKS